MRRLFTLLLGGVMLAGCSSLFQNPPTDDPADQLAPIGDENAGLQKFASESEFEAFVTDQVAARNGMYAVIEDVDFDFDGAFPSAPGDIEDSLAGVGSDEAAPGTDDGGFSGTTIQEVGVDEADVVKTDGRFVYVVNGDRLHIVDADQVSTMAELAQVPLRGIALDLYLHDDQVIALSQSYGGHFVVGIPAMGSGVSGSMGATEPAVGMEPDSMGGSDGNAVAPPADEIGSSDDVIADGPVEFEYQRPQAYVTVIDVSQQAVPRVLSTTAFDGMISSSRMIDGRLHLVMTNPPTFFYDVMPMLGRPEMQASSIDVRAMLPKYERTDENGEVVSGDVVTWRDVYRPIHADGFGVSTLVSMDVSEGGMFRAVGVVADPALIYASTEALYMTDAQFDFNGQVRETTRVYKFNFTDEGMIAVAAGVVKGRVLNQYSMGEHAGNLRVATTSRETVGGIEPVNNVYVLGQDGDVLEILGAVERLAPGEQIQSARFVGDRGYLVTFEQIDPLFTLDLSDPASPVVVGELKVPGFSTFIVPMDEDHLLTVGQYIPGTSGAFFPTGVQLSIFDVSDFANPVLSHIQVVDEGSYVYSEALWNPKAFTYFAEGGLVALPVSIQPAVDFPELIDTDGFIDDVVDAVTDMPGSGDPGDLPDGGSDMLIDLLTGQTDGDDVDLSDLLPDDVLVPELFGFDGIIVYEVSASGGFVEVGRVSTRFEGMPFYYGGHFTRSVFLGDEVLAVTNMGIAGAPIDAIDAEQHELSFDNQPLGEDK